jgi:hypothetical protein
MPLQGWSYRQHMYQGSGIARLFDQRLPVELEPRKFYA